MKNWEDKESTVLAKTMATQLIANYHYSSKNDFLGTDLFAKAFRSKKHFNMSQDKLTLYSNFISKLKTFSGTLHGFYQLLSAFSNDVYNLRKTYARKVRQVSERPNDSDIKVIKETLRILINHGRDEKHLVSIDSKFDQYLKKNVTIGIKYLAPREAKDLENNFLAAYKIVAGNQAELNQYAPIATLMQEIEENLTGHLDVGLGRHLDGSFPICLSIQDNYFHCQDIKDLAKTILNKDPQGISIQRGSNFRIQTPAETGAFIDLVGAIFKG